MIDGVLVSQSLFGVDFFVIRVYGEPRFGGSGESTVGRVILLHWCASVIAARFPYVIQVLFRTDAIG